MRCKSKFTFWNFENDQKTIGCTYLYPMLFPTKSHLLHMNKTNDPKNDHPTNLNFEEVEKFIE